MPGFRCLDAGGRKPNCAAVTRSCWIAVNRRREGKNACFRHVKNATLWIHNPRTVTQCTEGGIVKLF